MDSCFCCPLCAGVLTRREKSMVCPAGHTFDLAREGYLHLLPGGKGGVQHGDNREMLLARRDFLNSGYYQPLQEALCRTVIRLGKAKMTLLDAGCGECYYTSAMRQALTEAGLAPTVCGIDISKDALRLGAKRDGALQLAVAGVYRMPLPDASVDLITEIFAPLATEEYLRLLRPDGKLVLVVPGRRHLWSLKRMLYSSPYENEVADTTLAGSTLLSQETVEYSITLPSNADVVRLFAMTPYYYRTPAEGRARLAACEGLTTEVCFHIFSYRKTECK